jgi:hypothetical protein
MVGDAEDIIGEISDFARSRKLNITTINTLKPSLEDVFLKITELNAHAAANVVHVLELLQYVA